MSAAVAPLKATFAIPVIYQETSMLGAPVTNGPTYSETLTVVWTYMPGNFAGGTGALAGGLPAPFGASAPAGATVAVSTSGITGTLNGNYDNQTYDVAITFNTSLTGPASAVTAVGGRFDVAPVTVGHVTGEATGTVVFGPAAGGTDLLSYTGGQNANWADARSWADLTSGSISAAAAPASGNAVTINGTASGLYLVVNGPGAAASAGVTNQVSLSGGTFSVGAVTVGAAATGGSLAVGGGARLTGSTLTVSNGKLDAVGGAVALSGLLTLAAGPGGTANALDAGNGSVVQAAGLAMSGGTISIDGASSVEVGLAGGAAAGTLTVDAGASLTGTGSAGAVTDNGLIAAQGRGLTVGGADAGLQLGYVDGSGKLQVGAGATLDLLAGSAATTSISFAGATGTLRLHNGSLGTGMIGGFVQGDDIAVSGGGVVATGAAYQAGSNGAGTLSLLNGSAVVGTLTLAGSYTGQSFNVAQGASGGYDVTLSAAAPPPAAFAYTDQTANVSGTLAGTVYTGPVAGLQQQFIWGSADGVNITAGTGNVFLHGNAGNDALAVTSGTNVLDGGLGSNFLVGANGADGGADTFFVDGRGGGVTWSTVSNFHHGDAATIWGFTGASAWSWTALDGAQGHQGATIHSELGGPGSGVNASITFASVSLLDAQSKFSVSTGSVDGNPYLYLAYTG